MQAKGIKDFTDQELAAMVRNSIYARGTTFSDDHARFLLVLAIPYGPEDMVHSLPEAIDAFARLLQDDDWQERSFQVYDHQASQHYFQATRDGLDEPEEVKP